MRNQLSHRGHPLHPSSIRDVRSLLRSRFLNSLNDLHVGILTKNKRVGSNPNISTALNPSGEAMTSFRFVMRLRLVINNERMGGDKYLRFPKVLSNQERIHNCSQTSLFFMKKKDTLIHGCVSNASRCTK